MALQAAQLGYLPSMSTPSGGGKYVKPQSVWSQLATAALSAALTKGVDNALTSDYTSEAQQEGLPVSDSAKDRGFWQRVVSGPQTSERQLENMRMQHAQAGNTAMVQGGEDKRLDKTLAAQASEGGLNRAATAERYNAQLQTEREIAQGRNLTDLTNTNTTQAGAKEREQMGNDTALKVASGRENDRAVVAKVIADMMSKNALMRSQGVNVGNDDEQVNAIITQLKKLGYQIPDPVTVSSLPLLDQTQQQSVRPPLAMP